MPHYAPYDPSAKRTGAQLDAVIRPATYADVEELTSIKLTVVVRTAEDWIAAIDKTAQGERLLLVAVIDGKIGGFAQAHALDEDPEEHAPAGIYLTGVTVLPQHRRAGLAHAFTNARLDWIAERADEAWYFAAVENAASIRMHEAFGFVEVSRGPLIHGVTFETEGVLFRLDLTASRPPGGGYDGAPYER